MQLTKRVYLVGSGVAGFSLTAPTDCHVYLIDGGSELALIDAGAGHGVPEILQNMQEHGFRLEDLRFLFLTHVHADHAGGAANLCSTVPSLRVMVSKDGAGFLRSGDEKGISLDKGKEGGFYDADYRFEPCRVDVELVDQQVLQVGDVSIRVLDTPGHSSGHLAFLMKDAGQTLLFSGDAIFFGGEILLQNIWDCDLQAQLCTIQKLADLTVDVFLPGHGSVSLRDGSRHISAAMERMKRCLVPFSML
jgi:glyoxylase-like metal-dependent hydrolase (beta-lactamase superfamily II)